MDDTWNVYRCGILRSTWLGSLCYFKHNSKGIRVPISIALLKPRFRNRGKRDNSTETSSVTSSL
jgi:hypothetical protein